jgi:hypothetical protein
MIPKYKILDEKDNKIFISCDYCKSNNLKLTFTLREFLYKKATFRCYSCDKFTTINKNQILNLGEDYKYSQGSGNISKPIKL